MNRGSEDDRADGAEALCNRVLLKHIREHHLNRWTAKVHLRQVGEEIRPRIVAARVAAIRELTGEHGMSIGLATRSLGWSREIYYIWRRSLDSERG